MRVISRTELAHRSPRELAALFALVSDEVLRTRYQSPEWHQGMTTLENIRREQAAQKTKPRPPGP
jgi:hypothetical protein